MHYLKNKFQFGLGGIISLAALGAFVYFISPEQELIPGVPIRPLVILFVLLFATNFLLATFLVKNIRRGLLISLFLISSLVLWFFGFRDILYFGLILLIVLLIEAFFFHTPKHPQSNS